MMQQLWIIVPYRDRHQHLNKFIPHYRSILPDAKIVIVEQDNRYPFNRGWLLNCGFDWIIKNEPNRANYFAFHDVDMLYLQNNAHRVYGYPKQPTHIATGCSQFQYRMPYKDYCGGVILLNQEDFIKCNGFSNSYNGWGAEDDDFRNRMTQSGLKVMHIPGCIFQSMPHIHQKNARLHKVNEEILNRGTSDGLSNLNYTASVITHTHYTLLKVR